MAGNFLFNFISEADDQELVPFLHMHQEFSTSEQLFEQLKTIFYTCDNQNLQLKIAGMFTKWFSLRFKKDFWRNKELMTNVMNFSQVLDQVLTPPQFSYQNKFKLLFLQGVGRKDPKENPKRYLQEAAFKKMIHSHNGRDFKILLFGFPNQVDQLVSHLLVLDWTMFTSIESYELISNTWKRIPTSAVKNVVQYFNKFAHFVGTAILTEPEPEMRERLVCKFIMLADECREKKNYNSLMTILAGLNLHPVSRLRSLWGKIPRKVMEVKEKLDDLMDTRSNYKNYRTALSSATSNSFVIPYIGIYLRDILFIEEGNPAKLENGELNRERISLLAQILREIQAFQSQKIPQRLLEHFTPITSNETFHPDSQQHRMTEMHDFLERLTGCSEKIMDELSDRIEPSRVSVSDVDVLSASSSSTASA